MHILTLHSQKGGSGRSTLAVNLAVEAERGGRNVIVLDIDPQSSSAAWCDRREAETPTVTSVTPARMARALQTARNDGFDLAIIDTAPHSADAAIMAAEASDVLLIPCQPWVPDLDTLTNTARIVKLVGKPSYVVISQAPFAPRQVADAIEVVKEHELKVCPIVIHRRAAVAHAQTLGLAACEFSVGSKAAEDMAALYNWLSHNQINTDAQMHKNTNVRRPIRASA